MEKNQILSLVSGISSGTLTIVLSSQQNLSQQIISNNATLNKYTAELKNGQNITVDDLQTNVTPANTPV